MRCLGVAYLVRLFVVMCVRLHSFFTLLSAFVLLLVDVGGLFGLEMIKNEGPKIVKNGPRVWAFCKIEFPGIQKPVQIFGQKMGFFKKCGNRGVGVIWLVRGVFLFYLVLRRVGVVVVVLLGLLGVVL